MTLKIISLSKDWSFNTASNFGTKESPGSDYWCCSELAKDRYSELGIRSGKTLEGRRGWLLDLDTKWNFEENCCVWRTDWQKKITSVALNRAMLFPQSTTFSSFKSTKWRFRLQFLLTKADDTSIYFSNEQKRLQLFTRDRRPLHLRLQFISCTAYRILCRSAWWFSACAGAVNVLFWTEIVLELPSNALPWTDLDFLIYLFIWRKGVNGIHSFWWCYLWFHKKDRKINLWIEDQ